MGKETVSIVYPELIRNSTLSAYMLEIPGYIDSAGGRHSLDIARVYPDGSILVDCPSNGMQFADNIVAKGGKNYIVIWEKAREHIEGHDSLHNIDKGKLPGYLTASITDTDLEFSGKGAGAIFAIRLESASIDNKTIYAIEPECVYLQDDIQKVGDDLNIYLPEDHRGIKIDQDEVIGKLPILSERDFFGDTIQSKILGYILLTDGIFNLSYGQITSLDEICLPAKRIMEKVRNWLSNVDLLYASGDSEESVVQNYHQALKGLSIDGDPHDDATMIIVLDAKARSEE